MAKMKFKNGHVGDIDGSLSVLCNARQAISSNSTKLLWYALHPQDCSKEEFIKAIEDKRFCVAESATGKLVEVETIEEFNEKFI